MQLTHDFTTNKHLRLCDGQTLLIDQDTDLRCAIHGSISGDGSATLRLEGQGRLRVNAPFTFSGLNIECENAHFNESFILDCHNLDTNPEENALITAHGFRMAQIQYGSDPLYLFAGNELAGTCGQLHPDTPAVRFINCTFSSTQPWAELQDGLIRLIGIGITGESGVLLPFRVELINCRSVSKCVFLWNKHPTDRAIVDYPVDVILDHCDIRVEPGTVQPEDPKAAIIMASRGSCIVKSSRIAFINSEGAGAETCTNAISVTNYELYQRESEQPAPQDYAAAFGYTLSNVLLVDDSILEVNPGWAHGWNAHAQIGTGPARIRNTVFITRGTYGAVPVSRYPIEGVTPNEQEEAQYIAPEAECQFGYSVPEA